ncbi:phage tail tube protein [Streptomyces rimosus]|uniref:phage tail tube protein n=1 Tax=Streptomyces rimosus TaxID=1927 RepID=UPI00067D5E3D|nr:hypothetical protein [Streptomyces rimosus]
MAATGNDAKQIRFAPKGEVSVHFGALSADGLPQGVDDDLKASGFIALGYASEDGTEITPKIETEELSVWQASVPVLRYVKSAAFQVKTTLMQVNDATTRLFYGAEWVKVPGKNGRDQYRLDISSNPDLAEISLVVDWSDDAAKYRAVIGRAMVSDRGSISLTRTKNQSYELTLDALDSDGTLGYLLTDDPSVAPVANVLFSSNTVEAGDEVTLSGAGFDKDAALLGEAA